VKVQGLPLFRVRWVTFLVLWAVIAAPIGSAMADPKPIATTLNAAIEQQVVPKVPRATQRDEQEVLNKLYTFDYAPLAGRVPIILIPGRGEEYDQEAWWKKFQQIASDDPEFVARFKTYLFLYNSKDALSTQAQAFNQEFNRYLIAQPKPVVLLTYSLGGIITRKALEDPAVDAKVSRVLAVAVPFHGSPIFNPVWFSKYISPQSHSLVRKAWDRGLYRWYILSKTNLIEGLQWDNFDGSMPQFEVNATNASPVIPSHIPAQNEAKFKQKLMIYASYIENHLTDPKPGKSALWAQARLFPKVVVEAVLPFYGITEHAVMNYSNTLLANLATYTPIHPRGLRTHLYAYNDGAMPLSSLLYLPPQPRPYDGNIQMLTQAIDVPMVRLFKGLGHTDIGETGRSHEQLLTPDALHPTEGRYTPNEWIIKDLKAMDTP
jgi:predicted alpha/beta hydrolase family esterase